MQLISDTLAHSWVCGYQMRILARKNNMEGRNLHGKLILDNKGCIIELITKIKYH